MHVSVHRTKKGWTILTHSKTTQAGTNTFDQIPIHLHKRPQSRMNSLDICSGRPAGCNTIIAITTHELAARTITLNSPETIACV